MPHDDPSHTILRELDDGRVLFLIPITFNRARLGVGDPEGTGYDDIW